MQDNYEKIVQQNLMTLFSDLPEDLARNLPGRQDKDGFVFTAFGDECRITPEQVLINGEIQVPVLGILISLYALNAVPDQCILEPFKSFKEIPDSMPYAGAFVTHTEQTLVSYVSAIYDSRDMIKDRLNGNDAPEGIGGDFAFVVYPLPKIALCYVFYQQWNFCISKSFY